MSVSTIAAGDQHRAVEAITGKERRGDQTWYRIRRMGQSDELWESAEILEQHDPDAVYGFEKNAAAVSNSNEQQFDLATLPVLPSVRPRRSKSVGSSSAPFQFTAGPSPVQKVGRREKRPLSEIDSSVPETIPESPGPVPIRLRSGRDIFLPTANFGSPKKPHAPGKGKERVRRVSVFKEIGLEPIHDDTPYNYIPDKKLKESEPDPDASGVPPTIGSSELSKEEKRAATSWFNKLFPTTSSRKYVSGANRPPPALPSLPRVALLVSFLVLILPCVWLPPSVHYSAIGVKGRVVRRKGANNMQVEGSVKRDNSPTDVCTRWSQQSAIVNGTIYIYGGQAKTSAQQSSDTWNNNFLALPLTGTFQIASPTLKGLPQPSGPPPVANGFLWSSLDSLYLYGGLFSDKPATSPVPYSLWEYNIGSGSWKEHSNPKTSSGNNSEPGGQPVQRAAEGAGVSIPELGRGYYFGGHLDGYTTPGWSQSIPRVYLKSLTEFTYPGFTNDGVSDLQGGKGASSDGAWRNITQGGLQEDAGFPERADGLLVYIPGWGKEGILVGLAGGTNATFSQMNIIDIYDIGTSTWYKQSTSGTTPPFRVDPCAVVASAPDGSSFQIYMFAGQDLIPYGDQKQYDDMWILSVPSFTWIKVDDGGQSVPPARAGHTCHAWDSQMVVIGGYVGKDLSCDSPGIYVFDLSELKWMSSFTPLASSSSGSSGSSGNSGSSGSNSGGGSGSSGGSAAGQFAENSFGGLAGSYGYKVPKAVQSVIGGNDNGGATLTTPVVSATAGPLQTGKPPTFTVTQSGGIVTTTSTAYGQPAGSAKSGGPNKAAIIAGVVAGICFLAAAYFAFCAWVYRRQLALYKNHVAMAQRASYEGPEKVVAAGALPRNSGQHSGRGKETSSLDGAASSSNGPVPSSSGGYSSIRQGNANNTYQGYDAASNAGSSTEDLMRGTEPSFLGVLLSPRRSLRVINRD